MGERENGEREKRENGRMGEWEKGGDSYYPIPTSTNKKEPRWQASGVRAKVDG